MRKLGLCLAGLAVLAGCDKGASDLQSTLDKWVKDTRPDSHYEIGQVSNVSKPGGFYEFDVSVTDKDTGKVAAVHEELPFTKDGQLAFAGDSKMFPKMYPLAFEQYFASVKTVLGDPRYAGQEAQKVRTSAYCNDLDDNNPNTFSCTNGVTIVPSGGGKAETVTVINLMTWNGKAWEASLQPQKLTDGWWMNAERRLTFHEGGQLDIAVDGGGSAQDNWRDEGNGNFLIQYPGHRSMTGTWLEAPGPVARCPVKLTALTLTIVDCDYNRLIGTYHR